MGDAGTTVSGMMGGAGALLVLLRDDNRGRWGFGIGAFIPADPLVGFCYSQ